MKLLKLLLLFCAGTFAFSNASAQANATLNILTLNSGQVTIGQTVDVQVTVGNTGPVSAIGVNKVRVQISVPVAIASPLSNMTGFPPGWIILSNTGGVITICNGSDVIPVGAQRQILIKIQGNTVGGPSTIAGALSFGPGTAVCTGLGSLPGDITADNTSTSTVQVLAALPCTIGVTASAGTILCNGGTTTLTATPSGAVGAVEYSITGGVPFQLANTFTVPAGTYTVTAREVSNPTCTATSASVIISQPAAVPAPTVNVVQPTCTVATGTITITSATGGLTFSLDGGAYAAYPVSGYTVAAGPHTLTAQNTGGCISAITNITIDAQPATPAAPTVNAVQPTCTAATGTITITSSTAGLTFSFDGGAYAAYPVAGYTAAAGPHTLTAQNAGGCISAVTNITIDAQPATPAAPTVSIVQPTCTIATGTITVTSATAGLTFSLDGAAYATYPTGGYVVSSGAHTLTAQNTSACISSVTNITVNAQPATPAAPTVNTVQPTCTAATGTITITSSTAGLTFSFDGGTYAPYPVAGYTAAAGPHTLTAQNAGGCISAATNIIVDAQPVTPAAPTAGTIIQPTCAVSTGSVELSGLPAGNWTINPGAIAGNTAIRTISGLAPGTYNFTVTNSAGCTSVFSADVVINLVPGAPVAPTVSVVQPTCTVATATITITSATAGLTFSFDGGAYAPYPAAGYIAASGVHTLIAQNLSACISPVTNSTVNAQPPTPAAPVVNVVQPTCTVATATITITSATAGLTFSLDGGAYTAYPAGGFIVVPGAHTLTAQNTDNCISALTNITVDAQPVTPAAPTVGTITQPTCIILTGTVELGGLPAGQWTINPGAVTGNTATATISGLAPGTYNYTVTNSAGCTSSPSADVVITVLAGTPAAPTINLVQPTCTVATGIITVTSATAGLTFSLDGGAHAAYPAGGYIVSAGAHTLTAQNASLCTSPVTNITINVQPPTPAAPIVAIIQPTCTVATGTVTVTSATAGLTFSLDGGAYAAYPSGGYILASGPYTLTAQNTSGCISAVTIITVDAQPLVPAAPTLSVVQPTCTAAAGTITITSATAGLTFSVDGGAYAAYPAGGYLLASGPHTLTAQNNNGCISAVTNITVDVQPVTPSAPIVALVQPTCTVATGTITITSGTTGLLFSIDGGVYAAYPAGGYNAAAGAHTLNAQNISGCISTVTNITIDVQPASPAATVAAGTIACFGGTTTLTVTASGGVSPYEYSLNGGAFQAVNTFTVTAGAQTITVRDANLCIGTAAVLTVVQPATITVLATAGAIACFGGTTTLAVTAAGGTPPLQYSLNGGAYQSGNTFTISAGTYTVTVRDANLCTRAATAVAVTQPAVLRAVATASRITQCGGTAEITVSASGGRTPYTGAGTFTRGPGSYSYTVTDAGGCIATAEIIIEAPACINLKVYPNPAANAINVFHSIAEAGSTMQVFSVNGVLVLSKSIGLNAFQTTLDISRLAAGSYVLVFWNGKEKRQILFEKGVSN